MSAQELPTIDEMQATYDKFSAAVDREDTLGATIYAAVCAGHVAKLLKAKPLFAIAPDLLAALKAICPENPPHVGCECGQCAPIMLALTAIANAEGK